MSHVSAGILMYQREEGALHVLLVHPGGPFWKKRDLGAWSIPKGEVDESEDVAAAAQREFAEELGVGPAGMLQPLGRVRQKAGKWVEAFAVEGELDVASVRSNSFTIEWPPKSGRTETFPEIDRAEWFDLETAREKILEGQRPLLDRLAALLGESG